MNNSEREKTIDKQVGLRVRACRLAKDMTQQDVANKVGVKFQQVQKYETGKNRISISKLVLICEVLGVTVSSVLDDAHSDDNGVAIPLFTRDEIQLLTRYRTAAPQHRQAAKLVLTNS